MIPVEHIFYLSVSLLVTGMVLILTKRNAIMMLMGLELILNAANLNMIGFNHLHQSAWDGHLAGLFIVIIAVCEAAVGIAIILQAYRYYFSSVP
jgi:NADH:ubiquinone oxidoreductase subunit K